MKITIDTKEDSKEEIKKAISFLSSLSDGTIYTNCANNEKPSHQKDIFSDDPSPEVGGGMFSMFGSSSSPAQDSPSDSSAETTVVLEEEKKEPKKKPEIQVIEY